MVICVNRVTEVHDMATALAAFRDKICVIVGADNLVELAMGAQTEADKAQVVITTQAALKASLKLSRDFHRCSRYFFQGERRAVVCWDEAISFARPVALDSNAVMALSSAINNQCRPAATALKLWSVEVDAASTGLIEVPNFDELGLDFRKLGNAVDGDDNLSSMVQALGVLSGGTGHVLRDGNNSALVRHVPELPHGLLPMIVTDASAARGVNHASYLQMAQTRRINHLREATKTYRNLTLRIVPAAASRSAFRDTTAPKGRELVEMAVRYVKSVGPEPVLVVTYRGHMVMKNVKERTIEEAIRARLTPEENVEGRVAFLTYGLHTSTNKYKEFRRVLCSV
jgi:hypothetical protein